MKGRKYKYYIAIIIGFSALIICLALSLAKQEKQEKEIQPIMVEQENYIPPQTEEKRGVWIYYREMEKKASSKAKWEKYIDETFDVCYKNKINTIIFQVRPFADSMYRSQYFPWSKYATGTVGRDPGFDPFLYVVSAAHKRGLKIEAWINPYRVAYSEDTSQLADNSIAKVWMNSSDSKKRRNVLKTGGGLYFNPASSDVKELVRCGVSELVKNYDIDGVHMDDYFYPSLGEDFHKFDYKEYKEYKKTGTLSLVEWRRQNVDSMVKTLYETVKSIDSDCVFGISPAGNLSNLYSETAYYSDVKKWMENEGYIDYICPQIYWSFTQKQAPYKKMINQWTKLPKSENVEMYIGIASYRAGISKKESKEIYDLEWSKKSNILKRQVEYNRKNKNIKGFILFSFSDLQRKRSKKEISNLMKILN